MNVEGGVGLSDIEEFENIEEGPPGTESVCLFFMHI